MKKLLGVFIIIILLIGCELNLFWFKNQSSSKKKEDYQVYIIEEDHCTIEWDYEDDVDYFNIYYREIDEDNWNLIGSSETKEYIISRLSFGEKVISVVACDLVFGESDFHSSLDETAIPNTGWVLMFK